MLEFYEKFADIYTETKKIKHAQSMPKFLKTFFGVSLYYVQGSTFLFERILRNDVESVKKLNEIGFDIKSYSIKDINNYVMSPFEASIFNPEMFKFMLSIYSAGNDKTADISVIHQALSFNDHEIIKAYADAGYSLDEISKKHFIRPLESAILNNKIDLVETLLKNGAKPSKIDKNSYLKVSPLTLALRQEKTYEIALKLIEHGADVNEKHESISNLNEALFNFKDFKAAEFLVKNGADVNEIIYHNGSKVSIIGLAIMNQCNEAVKFLLENGADVNFKSELKGLGEFNAFELVTKFAQDSETAQSMIEHYSFNQEDIPSEADFLKLIGTTMETLDPYIHYY